jgi:hypothetical protein
LNCKDALPLLTETGHKVKDRVDHTPGQIATDRGEKHSVNVFAFRCGNTERTSHGENHDQPEENLGDSIHWFQQAFTRFD